MDYKKELEEIKQRVYNIATGTADVNYCNAKEIAEYIDPDLKHSEDEVMCDKLMHALDALSSYIKHNNSIIEPEKPIFTGDIERIKEWLMKKNLTGTTFKPRFKVGDWITNGELTYLIKGIDTFENWYKAETISGDSVELIFSYHDKNFHLWTINDARSGDVLCHEDKAFIFSGELEEGKWPFAICGLNKDDYLIISERLVPWVHSDVCPATKFEREYLFRKMNEIGYDWNERTKTLKRK
jgi:hypothetical protein